MNETGNHKPKKLKTLIENKEPAEICYANEVSDQDWEDFMFFMDECSEEEVEMVLTKNIFCSFCKSGRTKR